MQENNKTDLLKEYTEKIDEIIKFDEIENVQIYTKEIKKLIEERNYGKINFELYKQYNELLVKLEWVGINFSSGEKVTRLFSDHFQEVLDMEYYDLLEKFRAFLLGVNLLEERDKIKDGVKNILNRNQARFSNKKLNNNLAPTVENWIKIYTQELGTAPVDKLKLGQFYINNKDFKILSEEEKVKIKSFFKFYEKLKYSSFTIEGIEQTIPINTPDFKGWIKDGKLERGDKIDDKTKLIYELVKKILDDRNSGKTTDVSLKNEDIDELYKLANQYAEGSIERKAILEEIERMDH